MPTGTYCSSRGSAAATAMAPIAEHHRMDGIVVVPESMRCCLLGLHACIRVRQAYRSCSKQTATRICVCFLDCAERTCNPVNEWQPGCRSSEQALAGLAPSLPNQLQVRAFESQPADLTVCAPPVDASNTLLACRNSGQARCRRLELEALVL